LTVFGRVVANHRVGFTGPCLAISEDCNINAIKELLDGIFYQIKYIFLGGSGGQYIIELHESVVPRSFDL